MPMVVSSVSISSIAKVVSQTVRVAIGSIEEGGVSLGISLSLSLPLSVVVTIGMMSVSVVRDISLGGGIKSLSDRVQTGARSEWDTSVSIRVAITEVSSISLGLGIGGSLAVSDRGVWVSSVSQRSSSTGDRLVGSIDTGGGLASEGMKSIGIWISVPSVEQSWVSLSHTGSNKGTGNNKEFHG